MGGPAPHYSPDIRRCRFEGQQRYQFVQRHDCGLLFAQTPYRDRPVLDLLAAHCQDHRHLAEGVFAHLVVDFLVAQISFGTHACRFQCLGGLSTETISIQKSSTSVQTIQGRYRNTNTIRNGDGDHINKDCTCIIPRQVLHVESDLSHKIVCYPTRRSITKACFKGSLVVYTLLDLARNAGHDNDNG